MRVTSAPSSASCEADSVATAVGRCPVEPIRADSTVASRLWMRNSSGSIKPLTSASPSPRPALITSSSAPVTELIVNATPDVTAGTIRCTSTPMRASRPSCRARRYARACSELPEPRHSNTASTSRSRSTFRRVSWMPANECPSLSSPMPDDRTAKRVRGGAESSHGSVARRRISASVASPAIARPSGTGNPACFSRAQLNALLPTRGRSPGVIASSVFNACRATLSGLPRSRVGSVTI